MFRTKLAYASFGIFAMLLSQAVAEELPISAQITEIRQAIAMARTGSTVDVRYDAAMRIASLVGKIAPKDVDDETLANLTSLLDSPERSVRFMAAGSLGLLGPRAKSALPKLQGLLPEANCSGDLPSAPLLQIAIARVEGTPLPSPGAPCVGTSK